MRCAGPVGRLWTVVAAFVELLFQDIEAAVDPDHSVGDDHADQLAC
jgi:hypothetical protein